MSPTLTISTDILFTSKIGAEARALAAPIRFARTPEKLEEILAELNNPVCRKCKYDLRGLTDFHCCPECGTPVIWIEPTDAES